MRRLPMPLLVLIVVIALPLAIPIALASWVWDQRRMRAVAERTDCDGCGTILGAESLHRADTEWAQRVATLQSTRTIIMRLRMTRNLWAICAACGAEYDYDFRTRIFRRVARSHEPDEGEPMQMSRLLGSKK